MLSTLLELAAFSAIIAASYLAGGLIVGLYVLGPVLLLIGYSVDDEKAAMSVSRALAPGRRLRVAARSRWEQRRRRRELAKAG